MGIASLIVKAHLVFLTIKWLGVAYLAWMALSSLRSAIKGEYSTTAGAASPSAWVGYGQGFLCNATNPKLLVFYLSLLPQFVDVDAQWWVWLAHAWTLPAIGTVWCLFVVAALSTLRRWLERRAVRRALDAASGAVMLGFCAHLAREV
jgi:threonine/homoserine/homoserine lactone efflux protein